MRLRKRRTFTRVNGNSVANSTASVLLPRFRMRRRGGAPWHVVVRPASSPGTVRATATLGTGASKQHACARLPTYRWTSQRPTRPKLHRNRPIVLVRAGPVRLERTARQLGFDVSLGGLPPAFRRARLRRSHSATPGGPVDPARQRERGACQLTMATLSIAPLPFRTSHRDGGLPVSRYEHNVIAAPQIRIFWRAESNVTELWSAGRVGGVGRPFLLNVSVGACSLA